MKLTEISTSKSTLYRDTGQQHDALDSYMLCFQVEGSAELFQDGRSATLIPGEFTLYDAGRPMRIEYGDNFRCLAMLVPHHHISAPSETMSHLTAVRMKESSHPARVLGSLVRSIDSVLDSYSPASIVQFAAGAVDAISSTFASFLGVVVDEDPSSYQERLRLQISDYIDLHLADSSLTPESIARHFFVSLRSVQQLSSSSGGVSSTIRRRRIDRAERLLESPYDSTPVSDIAKRCGFTSHSHFSSAFKARTGESPVQYRERHRQLTVTTASLRD